MVRAALSPERLGLTSQAPSHQWLAELRRRVAERAPPTLYNESARVDPVPAADAVLASGWKLRDHPALAVRPPLPWGDVPGGDVNWHYSLNALQPLDDVLPAYARTHKEAYLDVARSVLLDWIDFNLTRNGKNDKKWYDMSTGYRAEKLAFVIDAELRRPGSKPREIALLLNAALEHTKVLQDPQRLAHGNHSVFMMLGLAALCHAIPELSGCDKDAAYARDTLGRFLDKQFFPDEAIHLEGAPGYHLFMSSTLDGLRRTGLFKDTPLLTSLFERVASRDYLMFHPNGDPVLIGDGGAARLEDYVDESPEARFVSSEGREGTAPSGSTVFPKTGYAIFRSPWSEHPFSQHSFLFFSATSHPSSHNHFDHLTFEWSERGQPLLVDSGKFTYDPGRLREFFRSTRAGSALEIDDKNLTPVKQLSSLRSAGESGPLQFVDAVAGRGPHLEQTRVLVLRRGQWLCVLDHLDASEPHTYRQWFQFHEQASAERSPDGRSLVLHFPQPGLSLFVQSLAPTSADLQLVKGSEKPLQGWISRDYEQRVPRYSASFTSRGESADLVTVLALDASPAQAQVIRKGDEITVSWVRNGAPEGFRYRVEDGRGQVSALSSKPH